MLEEIFKTGKLYGYQIDPNDEGTGIVVADNEHEAEEKVKSAYIKHGYPEDSFSNLEVWKISNNALFSYSPDVLEIC